MPNSIESRLARIEEGVNYIKQYVPPLVKISQTHSVQIALLKNNSRWKTTIFFSIATFSGVIGTMIVEWFKHS